MSIEVGVDQKESTSRSPKGISKTKVKAPRSDPITIGLPRAENLYSNQLAKALLIQS
ncbi:unnamed protein product [Acidithrix sp. C25]|nr:unnamed protein product [Acidithrix sp. C25]